MSDELFFDQSKYENYIKNRHTMVEFSETERHFLPEIIPQCRSILEVGAGAGGLYSALKENFSHFSYCGVEYDPKLTAFAKEKYPEATFQSGDFLGLDFENIFFDVSICYGLLFELPNYRDFIRRMVQLSRKYILIDVRLRYEGATTIDIDTSYVFYHSSGRRMHYIAFNVFEFLNFLQTEELQIKKVSAIGAYPHRTTSAHLPFPRGKMVVAVFLLEKFQKDETPKRKNHTSQSEVDRFCELDLNLPDFEQTQI